MSVREHEEPRYQTFSVFPSIPRGSGEQEGRQEKSYAISWVLWRSVEQREKWRGWQGVFSSSGMAEYTSKTRRVTDATQRKLETQGITRYELNTKADLPSRFSRWSGGEWKTELVLNAGLLITADPLQVRGGWSGKQNSAPQSESWHRNQSGKLHQKT